jgi:MEMO1 family protein
MNPTPRPPAVAGQFYEADGANLARQLEGCFLSDRGPGELPARQRTSTRRIRAAVVPHAGYEYSGPIAALAYRAIAGERPPESVLILGVDHHGVSQGAALSARDWTTPLGPTACDRDLVAALNHSPLAVDEAAHAREYSIEVQLPFLEYVLPRPKFVALEIAFDSFANLERIAQVVRAAVASRDVLLVASTDFSHYLPVETARLLDSHAIEAILARDARRLYDTVGWEEISMCGIAPTTVLLAALAGESLTARLLRWGHSGEVVPMRDVVAYAALLLESESGLPPSVK